ncbi:MAG: peptidoglycan DD-metalloendopeptidase family protein [Pseudomonadota bacterium]
MRFAAILALAIIFTDARPLAAQQSGDLEALTRAEAEARQSEAKLRAEREAIEAEIVALKRELARDTEQTQAFERESERIAERLAESEATLARLQGELSRNRADTQTLLAALQRLQLAPSPATLANPDDAVRTAQAATMIDLLSDTLQERAAQTVALAARVTEARDTAARQSEELAANATELERRRIRTQALVAQKETLQASILTDETKARNDALRFAAEAATLRELLERVTDIPDNIAPRIKPGRPSQPIERGPVTMPPGTVRFAEAQGGVVRPVSGQMTAGFGRGEKGQTYSARGGGQVIAPYAGRVEFAGPFRNYGRVVILNMSDGYYLLLTGLGETFVTADEMVRRGEPVGRMPASTARVPLYVELRRNGRSVDPEPWMGRRR